MTCTRAQEFLVRNKLESKELVDAKKTPIGRADALKLAAQVDEVYTSKGSKVVYLNIKQDKPDDDTIVGLLLGPTGNLRAPTIRKGKTLVVGFNEDTYKKVLLK